MERLFDLLLVLSVYFLCALFLVTVTVVVSCGFLVLLNYVLTQYPVVGNLVEITNFNINISLVIATSILVSINVMFMFMFIFGNSYISEVRDSILERNSTDISENLTEILSQTEKIEYNTSSIQAIEGGVGTLEFIISSERENFTESLDEIKANTKQLQYCIESLERTVENNS